MTLDDVKQWAIQAGDDWDHMLKADREFLLQFANIVAAAEREACMNLWEASKIADNQIAEQIEAAVQAEREACAAEASRIARSAHVEHYLHTGIERGIALAKSFAAAECAIAIRTRGTL